MELTKCKLGELITQRREKNDGSDLPICGVSKDGLIPPKQKDADTSIYNVFYRDDFIFNPARMELNSIAINDMYDRAICSSLYEVFYVHRTDLLLPHYLKLIIRQKWFTRYCEFLGQGSAREYCRFSNISEIEIEFPPIEEQQKIVDYNTAIENRIALKQKINDNLEATLAALYKEFFTITSSDTVPLGWRIAPFSDIATVTMGQSPEGDDCNNAGIGEPLLNGPTEFGFYSPSPVQWTTNGKKHCVEGDLLFCVRGSTTGRMNWANQSYAIGRGLAAIHHKSDCTLNWFVKAMIDNSLQEILSAATGSTFPNVGKDLLNGFQVIIPDDNSLRKFGVKGHSIFSMISNNAKEIDVLLGLQRTLLSKLTI